MEIKRILLGIPIIGYLLRLILALLRLPQHTRRLFMLQSRVDSLQLKVASLKGKMEVAGSKPEQPRERKRNVKKWPDFPPLKAEHTEGARLFADRVDALQMLPKNGRIAEIGVARGDFSRRMIDLLEPVKFDAFDVFRLHEAGFFWGKDASEHFNNLSQREFYERRFETEITSGHIEIFEGDGATRMTERPNAYYDIIYVDGNHSYKNVLRDAVASAPKLKQEGILVFNDYVLQDCHTGEIYGVVPVVNEFCVERGWKIVYFVLQRNMFCDIALKRA